MSYLHIQYQSQVFKSIFAKFQKYTENDLNVVATIFSAGSNTVYCEYFLHKLKVYFMSVHLKKTTTENTDIKVNAMGDYGDFIWAILKCPYARVVIWSSRM